MFRPSLPFSIHFCSIWNGQPFTFRKNSYSRSHNQTPVSSLQDLWKDFCAISSSTKSQFAFETEMRLSCDQSALKWFKLCVRLRTNKGTFISSIHKKAFHRACRSNGRTWQPMTSSFMLSYKAFLRIALHLNKTRNATVFLLLAWNACSEICALLTTWTILALRMGLI